MQRVTETDKWRDAWFTTLSVRGKLLFVFLFENCDEAGFYELNYKLMNDLLGFSGKGEIIKHLGEIKRCFVPNKKRSRIWLKNYLKHQEKLPLNSNEPDHKRIILILEKHIDSMDNQEDMRFILDRIEKTKSKRASTKRFVKPNINEFTAYFNELGVFDGQQIESLYDHYESCGWKVGNKSMKDWKAAIRNSLRRTETKGSGKLNTMKQASDSFLNRSIPNEGE